LSRRDERLDVALNRLCLTRTRSEAKRACEAGAILIDGRPARPSDTVKVGGILAIRFPRRLLEIRLLDVPEKSISKQAAREMYAIIRDEHVEGL
jgi:ribosomal 50S subunit-recycling heat shock protein